MTSLAGQRLGRYRLEALLGRGGMAEVFRAADEALERTVAVKVVLPAFAQEPEFSERFLREAKVAAGLEHPHVLPVYDFGQDGGRPYLVMQYVGGGSVAQRMTHGAVRAAQAVDWLRGVAGALDFAHRRGVLHRDVKPANVLLGEDGRALLADFGIAKAGEASTRLTATGIVLGTPAYMAPELILGGEARPASDLYALAVMAYELLCGVPPFRGESAFAVLHQHAHVEAPRLTAAAEHLPKSIDPLFERALAKQPERRPPSGRQFTEELAAAIATLDSGAVVDTGPAAERGRAAPAVLVSEGPARRTRVRPLLPWVAAALVAGLGTIALVWRIRSAAPESPPSLEVPARQAAIQKPAAGERPETAAGIARGEASGAEKADDRRPSTDPPAALPGRAAASGSPASRSIAPAPVSSPREAPAKIAGVVSPVPNGSGQGPVAESPVPTRPLSSLDAPPAPIVPARVLTREDFERLLVEAQAKPGSAVARAVAAYARGGLAYLNGDSATARSTLEGLRAGAPIEALGPWFRQTLKGELTDWSLPLAYAQPVLALEVLRAAISRGDSEAARAAVPVSRALLAAGQRIAAKDLLARACAAGNELACERPTLRPQRRAPLRRKPGGG